MTQSTPDFYSNVELLMESRGFATGARSTFSKTWSKLFKIGPYFVDVSCTPEGNKAKLEGQVMYDHGILTEGQINLKGTQTLRTNLDEYGHFGVFIEEPGVHTLELTLGVDHLLISDLALT